MSELLLNQFEQDRALVSLRYKNLNIRKLFGKSVFIAGGGELAFSLVSSLRMVNLKKQAGIAVFSLNAVNKCGDILIETGFLLSDRVEGVDVFKNHINRANNIISAVNALKIKETVLVSDASIYGTLGKDFVISEKEKTHSAINSDSFC